jgi:hypothetical protein
MKNILITSIFLLLAFSPIIAQEVNEEVPVERLTLKKDKVPPAVIQAANEIFKGSNQVQWGTFPYELKKYGWVVDKNYSGPVDRYEVNLKANNGSDIFAIFESNGDLIRYRTVDKNAAVPAAIRNAIAKTAYKDWKITGDTEIIKGNQKNTNEHYIIRLVKGNQKKMLYYNLRGEGLTNR